MPTIEINGFEMSYEELGDGEPLVITAGILTSLEFVRGVAQRLAHRHRVIIWDRRNYGASQVSFPDRDAAEAAIWADDLRALLEARAATPAWVAGFSLGAGASLKMAVNHPQIVRGLLLSWIAGGPFPRDDFTTSEGIPRRGLVRRMYGEFVEAAERGGMAAVADTPWFKQRSAQNPRNRELLLATPVEKFVATMRRWEAHFRRESVAPPLDDAEVARLARLDLPTLVVSGDDHIHPISAAQALHALIPGAEYCPPLLTHEQWYALAANGAGDIAEFRAKHVPPVWLDFIDRHARGRP